MFMFMYHPTLPLLWRTQEESWPGEWLGDATSIMFEQINLGKFHPFDINRPCNIGRSPQRWGYGPWWACLEKTEWIAFTLILQNHFNDDLPSCHTKNIPKNWQPCCNSSISSQKQHNQRALWMFHIQIRDVLTQKNWILFVTLFCWNMAHLRSLPIKPSHA